MNPDDIIRIEGGDLVALKEMLLERQVYLLRIHKGGLANKVKFKFNEGMWTPSCGRSELDYRAEQLT